MSDFVIETKKLTKIYGEQTAVSSVDIHVKPGRIYGLLGRNGAGKTTIMKMILGLTPITSGEVDVFGQNIKGHMFFVIDSRYRSRRPMIITTNLKLAELKNPPDLAHARIYDRILERCAPILFAGKNFREENAGATKQAAKDIVNRKHE